MKTLLNRYAPLTFTHGQKLKNRVVIPPMASETASPEGFVTLVTQNHYERLSKASPGLLMVEYTYVHLSGRSEEFQLGIDSDTKIEGLETIRKIIQASGAIAGIQLSHAGGKSEEIFTGGVLMGPSAIRVPVKGQELNVPTPMSSEDITMWINSFKAGIIRAVKAGFDLVEFHAAHGYGINQFLSPLTNQRDDEYGGSLKNNSRLLFDLVHWARQEFPYLLLAVRMPGQDFTEGGLTPDDCIYIAHELELLGVDVIDVSSGIGGWKRPGTRSGEGYLVNEATLIQSHISVPVIGVGGIVSGEYIDQVISNNSIALAAVGRAILKDPLHWGEEHLKEKIYA